MEKIAEQFLGSLPVGALILVYLYVIDRKLKETCRRLGKVEDWFVEHLINKSKGG